MSGIIVPNGWKAIIREEILDLIEEIGLDVESPIIHPVVSATRMWSAYTQN